MNKMSRKASRGFTLIEVLIAMLVVALGIGALLSTLSASAETVGRLRDKSFAQWIALNQISSLRLSGSQPAEGVTYGTTDFAGSSWKWQQEITDPGVAGMVRVEVRVAPQVEGADAPSQPLGDTPMPSVGSAFGFLGSSVARPSGQTPDWSYAAIQSTGTGRRGGGGGGGGGAGGGGGTGGDRGGDDAPPGGGEMTPIRVP
jgi:general secretion pathway protein I